MPNLSTPIPNPTSEVQGTRTLVVPTVAGPVHVHLSGTTEAARPLVVLLPAAAHDERDFGAVRPSLHAAGFATATVDWPAHGASPAPVAAWRPSAAAVADLAEVVVDRLRGELGVATVGLVGNSVGGFSAARLALRRPDVVWGAVLVNAGGFGGRSPLVRAFCRVMGSPSRFARLYPAFCRRYMQAGSELDHDVVAAATATAVSPAGRRLVAGLWRSFSGAEHDLRAEARERSVPLLLVWGARDPVIPVRVGRRASRLLGAELVTMDTGHVPFASRPDEFADHVLPFLRSASSAAQPSPTTDA